MSDSDAVIRIEGQLVEVSKSQAVHSSRLDSISGSMDRLVKAQEDIVALRAETLHIIKAQEVMNTGLDEAFTRLRGVEQKKPQCQLACENRGRVENLEKNQRWGVRSIIGLIVAYAMLHIFGQFKP